MASFRRRQGQQNLLNCGPWLRVRCTVLRDNIGKLAEAHSVQTTAQLTARVENEDRLARRPSN
jgi:hypothetical protein